MNFADLDDKMQRKRNLRYYTSKIDQASKKNMAKLTGDADLPYQERMAERERRLAEEARLRGLKHEQNDEADRFSDNEDEDTSKKSKSQPKRMKKLKTTITKSRNKQRLASNRNVTLTPWPKSIQAR